MEQILHLCTLPNLFLLQRLDSFRWVVMQGFTRCANYLCTLPNCSHWTKQALLMENIYVRHKVPLSAGHKHFSRVSNGCTWPVPSILTKTFLFQNWTQIRNVVLPFFQIKLSKSFIQVRWIHLHVQSRACLRKMLRPRQVSSFVCGVCGCFGFSVLGRLTSSMTDTVRVHALFWYSWREPRRRRTGKKIDTPNEEAQYVFAQFAFAKTNLCYDLAKAKKATDGEKDQGSVPLSNQRGQSLEHSEWFLELPVWFAFGRNANLARGFAGRVLVFLCLFWWFPFFVDAACT